MRKIFQRNTWIGLTTLFSSVGYHFTDATIDEVATIGAAICGFIVAVWPEADKPS